MGLVRSRLLANRLARTAGHLGILLSTQGIAQTVAMTEANTEQSANALGEIVVTAQRREERLQDVPISVTALNSAALSANGVQDVSMIAQAVPSMTMVRAGASGTLQAAIRGIGTTSSAVGQEPPVATYVDGFYLPTSNIAIFSFDDIDRVEVLKGPQGTLFGRNASAGVIQIITKDPTAEPTANLDVAYERFDTVKASAYGSTGLSDTVAADLALTYKDQAEGWGRNLLTGREVNKENDEGIRGKVLYTPSDSLKLIVAADFLKDNNDFGPARNAIPGGVIPLGVPFAGTIYDEQSNVAPFSDSEQWGLNTTLTADLPNAQIINRLGYTHYVDHLFADIDNGPFPLVQADLLRYDKTFTEELQVSSTKGSSFDWILGAFYIDYKSGLNDEIVSGAAVPTSTNSPGQQSISSPAAFAQAGFEVFADTRLTLGARYTLDQVTYQSRFSVGGGAPTILEESTNHGEPTWRIALDHKFTPDVMAYVSYNRGYKTGVFNSSVPATAPPVKPEEVDAYEIGLKSTYFDDRLRFNVAGFYSKFRDLQLIAVIGTEGILVNAASSTIKGIEVQTEANLAAGLNASFDVSYLDATYNSFPDAPIFTALPNGLDNETSGNATGNQLIRAPRWTYTTGLNYTRQTEVGEFKATVSWYHTSGFFYDFQNLLRQHPYDLLNAQLRWGLPNRKWGVRLYADNLTNTQYYSSLEPTSLGNTESPAPPRVFGVGVDFKF
jgi:iron complex outermembrane recepter protein